MASLKVAVRVRPFNQREIDMGAQLIVQMDGKKTRLSKPKSTSGRDTRDNHNDFTFDFSYCSIDNKDSNYIAQDQVYEDLGTDVIECAFQGYNACVFAYGQTGSGKTFTMMGSSEMQGLIPRICQALFTRMQLKEESGIGYKTHVSYLEIYNEKVKDLLGPETVGHGLKVREHRILGPYVEHLSQHPVSDYSEIQECIYKGNSIRTTASTNMNDTSSRSHAIFTITFVQAGFRNDMPSETVSKIHLVDLAGSERANATGATGQRLKEGAHINKSLVTLGSVISALADQTNLVANKKLSYIPYRDSVLTWLLKDSLGGNSKTIMIAAISPADCNYSETLSTLRYANRAKNIINKPTINEDPNVKLIRELREEIYKLKSMLDNDSNVEPSLKVLEDLLKKEAQEKVLTEEWTEKWRETQNILREEKSLGLRKSGFGVVLDSEMPHLIGIHDDISTGVTLYSLKEGRTSIGTDEDDDPQDIVLSGIGIYPQHCSIILHNGTATICPNLPAQCWLNANAIEEPTAISQGDILLLGRTNMFRFNNPAEAARLRKDPSRSRLDLSRLSLIAASRENLNSSFICDDDLVVYTSPFKRNERQYFASELLPKEDIEIQDENKKILESIENALKQLNFERSQMYQHYKNKLYKLTEELERLEKKQENNLAILNCKERELLARREMLIWERDNEKSQVDIVVRQLSTLQLQLEKKKKEFYEYVNKTLQELQDSDKLDEVSIKLLETTSLSEDSSEVLIFMTKSIDNFSAQYIKDNIKKNKNVIAELEAVLDDKQESLEESTNKLCALKKKLIDLDIIKKSLENERTTLLEGDKLEMKKKSLSLELTKNQLDTNQIKLDSDTLETFHTANSDYSIKSSPQQQQNKQSFSPSNDNKLINDDCVSNTSKEIAMSDSGVCLDSQRTDYTVAEIATTTSSSSAKISKNALDNNKSTDDDDNLSCFSCELSSDISECTHIYMNKLRKKIAIQKANIMKILETESNKKLLDEQIELLQLLQKEYLKLEFEYCDKMKNKNDGCLSEDIHNIEPIRNLSLSGSEDPRLRQFSSQQFNYNLPEITINPTLARSLTSIATYHSDHYLSIPSFIVRGAGKQTHFEYEIKINLPDGRWTLLRRYSRFRDLHLSMKSCYGQKVAAIPFPRRELFASNSESVAKCRRRQLESYIRRLLVICSKIPQSPIYEGNGNIGGITKQSLVLLSPFFKKGLFESGKHGTG